MTALHFHSPLALRIANCIMGDIENLTVKLNGKKVNWQSMFERPYKAAIANWVMEQHADNEDSIAMIMDWLKGAEKTAQDYANNPNKRGRPLAMWKEGVDGVTVGARSNTDTASTYSPAANEAQRKFDAMRNNESVKQALNTLRNNESAVTNDELNAIVNEFITESAKAEEKTFDAMAKEMGVELVPVMHDNGPSFATQKQTPTKEDKRKQEPAAGNEADALVQALAAFMQTNKTESTVVIDEDLIRKIAKEEALKASSGGNVITVDRTNKDGTRETANMGVQHKQFETLLKLAQVRDHHGYVFPIWLPGPAGSGKTTAAMNVAKSFGLAFHHNGAIDTEYKLLGFTDAGGKTHRTPFREAYEHGGVYLFDEVDASNPQALVALNAALENGHGAFPDATITRHPDCIVIAAANTYGAGATHEYVGRNKLDAATVDRFVMLDWQYDEKLERTIAGNNEWVALVNKIRKAVASLGIKHVVSPRASIRGAALLAAGFDKETVLHMVVFKGMAADQITNVNQRAGNY